MFTRERGRSGRVTQRCHNSPRWEARLQSAGDVTHQKRAKDFGNLKKVSRVETCFGRRRLAFASSRGLVAGVARNGGADEKARIERLCLSLLTSKNLLNSKIIKSFVPELRSRKCFSCFEIPMFYVYMLWTSHVHFAYSCIWLWNTSNNSHLIMIFVCSQLYSFKYSYLIQYISIMKRSICLRDEILTGTLILNQSRPGSNGNKEVLHTPQISRTRPSLPDTV